MVEVFFPTDQSPPTILAPLQGVGLYHLTMRGVPSPEPAAGPYLHIIKEPLFLEVITEQDTLKLRWKGKWQTLA